MNEPVEIRTGDESIILEENEVKALIRHCNIYREWGMEDLVPEYVFALKLSYAGF